MARFEYSIWRRIGRRVPPTPWTSTRAAAAAAVPRMTAALRGCWILVSASVNAQIWRKGEVVSKRFVGWWMSVSTNAGRRHACYHQSNASMFSLQFFIPMHGCSIIINFDFLSQIPGFPLLCRTDIRCLTRASFVFLYAIHCFII